MGPRRPVAVAGLRALCAAHGRGDPSVPVPRRCRGDPPRLPPGCDDPRREPAPRADARRPRVLDGGRAVTERLRRRGRDRPGDRRLDHDRRSGGGHRALPRLAVRRHVSRPHLDGIARPRDLRGLLPPAVPVRRGRGRPPATAVGAPWTDAGPRGGLRHQSGMGTRRPAPARQRVAPGGSAAARARLGAARLVRAGGGGASRRPRAGRDRGPHLVRQDRGRRTRRTGAAAARVCQRRRSTGRRGGLRPAPRRARRDARGPDRHPARRRSIPGHHGRRLAGGGPRLDPGERP